VLANAYFRRERLKEFLAFKATVPNISHQMATAVRELYLPWTVEYVPPEDMENAFLDSKMVGRNVIIKGLTEGYPTDPEEESSE